MDLLRDLKDMYDASAERKRKGHDTGWEDNTKRTRAIKTFLGHPLNRYDIDEITVEGGGADKLSRLTALCLSIPEAQKSLQVKNQVARDADGRRAFHGAFSGGFSAGYRNTVGSSEGWAPSSFSSSNKNRATTQARRIEDYMDDQDMEDMMSGNHPSSFFCSAAPDARYMVNTMTQEDDHPFKASALEFLVLPGVTPGHRILRSMGWREGIKFVMVSIPRPPDTTVKRRLGPECPASLRRPTGSDSSNVYRATQHNGSKDDLWFERRQTLFHGLLEHCDTMRKLNKSNREGLGYLNRRPQETHKSSSNKGSRAFGFGVLQDEEEWDADEDTTSLSTSALDLRCQRQRVPLVFVSSKRRSNPFNEIDDFIKGFDIQERYPLPPNFVGRYTPSKDEQKHQKQLQHGDIKGIVAALVDHFQRHRPKLNVCEDLPSGSHSTHTESHKGSSRPLWSTVTRQTKDALLKSLSVGNRFVTSSNTKKYENLRYPSDTEKQTRYDMFCLALLFQFYFVRNQYGEYEERIPAGVVLNAQKTLTEEEAKTERLDFGNAYRDFREQHPNVQLRKVDVGLVTTSLPPSVCRTTFNWNPSRLLCKRYKVSYPWEHTRFVDNSTENTKGDKMNLKNLDIHTKVVSTSALVNSFLALLDKPPVDAKPEIKSSVSTSTDNFICNVRPPVSIFKSVFGDGDDNDV